MALYFFHLRDGQDVLLDPEGLEFPSLDAAKAAALLSARSILASEVLTGRLPLDMHLDVQDESGTVVHLLPFADALEIIPAGPRPETGGASVSAPQKTSSISST